MTTRRKPANQGPRVALTLTPELDALLARIGAATGVGKATFVRQMLETAQPQLELIASAAEKVTTQNVPDGLALMATALRQASGMAEQQQLELTKRRRAMRRIRKPAKVKGDP